MRYLLKNVTIYERTNARGNYKWLYANLFNDADIFANSNPLPTYYMVLEEMVEMYTPYAKPDASRTTADQKVYTLDETAIYKDINENKIPDIMHIDHVFAITLPLPRTYAKVHKSDRIENNMLVAKAGDFVRNSQGEITPVNTLTLYIKKRFDPEIQDVTKQWDWVRAPELVMRDTISRSYKEYNIAPVATEAVQDTAPAPETTSAQTTTEEEIERARAILAAANGN